MSINDDDIYDYKSTTFTGTDKPLSIYELINNNKLTEEEIFENRKKNWINILKDFFYTIIHLLKELLGQDVQFKSNNTEIYDEVFGAYRVPTLEIIVFRNKGRPLKAQLKPIRACSKKESGQVDLIGKFVTIPHYFLPNTTPTFTNSLGYVFAPISKCYLEGISEETEEVIKIPFNINIFISDLVDIQKVFGAEVD